MQMHIQAYEDTYVDRRMRTHIHTSIVVCEHIYILVQHQEDTYIEQCQCYSSTQTHICTSIVVCEHIYSSIASRRHIYRVVLVLQQYADTYMYQYSGMRTHIYSSIASRRHTYIVVLVLQQYGDTYSSLLLALSRHICSSSIIVVRRHAESMRTYVYSSIVVCGHIQYYSSTQTHIQQLTSCLACSCAATSTSPKQRNKRKKAYLLSGLLLRCNFDVTIAIPF